MKTIKTYYGKSQLTWAVCLCTVWRTAYPYQNTGIHKSKDGGCGEQLRHFDSHDELTHDGMVKIMKPLGLRVVGGERNIL